MSKFGGRDGFGPEDEPRLATQLYWVYALMFDAQWRTIEEIRRAIRLKYGVNATDRSISARLRDFRKTKFGGHIVNRNGLGHGLFEYQLVIRKTDDR